MRELMRLVKFNGGNIHFAIVKCYRCGGTGTFNSGETCYNCNGAGVVNV